MLWMAMPASSLPALYGTRSDGLQNQMYYPKRSAIPLHRPAKILGIPLHRLAYANNKNKIWEVRVGRERRTVAGFFGGVHKVPAVALDHFRFVAP